MHICRKCSELVTNQILHQDNMLPHKAHWVTEFLEEHNIKIMEHSPYSVNLALCDFWLFSAPKKAIRGQQFDSDREFFKATQIFFKNLPESQFCTRVVPKVLPPIFLKIEKWC